MYGVSRLDVCEDVALISLNKIPVNLGLLADIFGQFSSHKIVLDMISQTAPVGGHVSISFTCLDRDMVKALEIVKVLSSKYPQIKPMVSSGNCKLQLFGEEMRTAHGVFAKALGCLDATDVELQQVSTSEVDISLLVDAGHAEEAIVALQKVFAL